MFPVTTLGHCFSMSDIVSQQGIRQQQNVFTFWCFTLKIIIKVIEYLSGHSIFFFFSLFILSLNYTQCFFCVASKCKCLTHLLVRNKRETNKIGGFFRCFVVVYIYIYIYITQSPIYIIGCLPLISKLSQFFPYTCKLLVLFSDRISEQVQQKATGESKESVRFQKEI